MITDNNNTDPSIDGVQTKAGTIEKYQFYLGGELNDRMKELIQYRTKLTGSNRVVSSLMREAIELLLQKWGH